MRYYETQFREGERYRVKIDRIGKTHIESRGQPKFGPHPDRQHAAVNEYPRARLVCGDFEQRAHAFVLHGVAVHRGKQANTMDVAFLECAAHSSRGVGRGWVHHEMTEEAFRISTNRGRHGLLVAGDA